MRELVPLGVVVKPQLPMYLTSWVDKTSTSCMYSVNQLKLWSAPHLKEGCWYLECGRNVCPVEEEDVKAACDKADPRGVKPIPEVVVVPEELSLADIALLPAKERNKILSQKARDAKKVEREAAIAEKVAKKAGRTGKSKVITPQTETSTVSPLQSARKRDSTFAELSVSRLQLCSSPYFEDCAGGTLLLDELFLPISLDATASFYLEHNAFPKEWLDLQGFLQKVFLVSFSHCFMLSLLKC